MHVQLPIHVYVHVHVQYNTIKRLTKLCDFGLEAFNFILKLGLSLQNDFTTAFHLL